MTFEQIRQAVARRMQQWADIPAEAIEYPNASTPVNPEGLDIWVRVVHKPGETVIGEVGNGVDVIRTGALVFHLFVPEKSGSELITRTIDGLCEHFEFYSDPTDPLDFYAASVIDVEEDEQIPQWYQMKLSITYQAG